MEKGPAENPRQEARLTLLCPLETNNRVSFCTKYQ